MGLFSGIFGGGGTAKRAAGVRAAGQREAADLVDKRYQETAGQFAPYQEAGTGALTEYQRLAGGLEAPTAALSPIAAQMDPIVEQIRGGDFTTSPGYEFRRAEGQKAIERSAANRGGLMSAGLNKELERYGQDYATSEYDNYLGRLRNQLTDVQTQLGGRQSALNAQYQNINAYSPLIQTGYGATSTLGALGADAAKTQGGFLADASNSAAQGMETKAAQMAASGDWWKNEIDSAATAIMGMYTGGAINKDSANQANLASNYNVGGGGGYQPSYGGGGGYASGGGALAGFPSAQAVPVNNANIQYGQYDQNLPWLQQGNRQQKQLQFQTSYR